MAGIRVHLTCPVCRLLIRFDHAITYRIEGGRITVLAADRAIALHTCIRGVE